MIPTTRALSPLRYAVAATLARTVVEGAAITFVLVGTDRDVTPLRLGVLTACTSAPQVVTAPWLGSRLDRAARPAALLAALVTVIGAGIGVIGAGLGVVPIAILCLVAVGWSVAEPAVMGGLSGIGSRSSSGDGRFETADATSYGAAAVAGQAVVALAVLAAGPWTAVAVLVALALAAAVLVSGLPLLPAPIEEASGGHVRAALGLIGRDPELRSMTVLTTISMSAFGGLALAAVGVAKANGRDADAASVAVLAMAIGAVAGSLSSRRLGVAAHPVAWAYGAVATVGLSFGLAAVAPWPAVVALFAVAGFADGPLLTATFAVRTTRTPLRVRASVYTIAASAKIAGSALGAVVVGALVASADTAGVVVLAVAQILALVGAAVTGVGAPAGTTVVNDSR